MRLIIHLRDGAFKSRLFGSFSAEREVSWVADLLSTSSTDYRAHISLLRYFSKGI